MTVDNFTPFTAVAVVPCAVVVHHEGGTVSVTQPRPGRSDLFLNLEDFTGEVKVTVYVTIQDGTKKLIASPTLEERDDDKVAIVEQSKARKKNAMPNSASKDVCKYHSMKRPQLWEIYKERFGRTPRGLKMGEIQKILRDEDDTKKAPTGTPIEPKTGTGGGDKPDADDTKKLTASPTLEESGEESYLSESEEEDAFSVETLERELYFQARWEQMQESEQQWC
mmetsp:Transcript_26060/g.63605  ORF Transcript_26060/g.63605 Transcript_26060/m.63605 type:complete len:223 (-) Transcript_26060:39-707(-)